MPKVYQIWDSDNPATSDQFCPNVPSMQLYIEQVYGIKNVILDRGEWEGEDGQGNTVHVKAHVIKTSCEDICLALNDLPNR